MGLFDTLGIDMSEIEAAGGGFTNPPDDYYEFEISESSIRIGTKADPNVMKYVIEYNIGEAGTTSEWYTIAEDGEVTAKAKNSLRYLKERLEDLGVDSATFDPEEDDLSGIRGSFQLKTNDKGFQNVRNVTVEETEAEDEPETEEEPDTAAEDAARKKRLAANKAARETTEAPAKAPAKKAPAKRAPAAKSVDEENPFE